MTDTIREYTLKKLRQKDFDCAKEYTLAMFSGKYKLLIICSLYHNGAMRFNELQQLSEHATHKMMTQQLKEMIKDGLISRHEQLISHRKAVFYQLTNTGESLMPIIDAMCQWGEKRLQDLKLDIEFCSD